MLRLQPPLVTDLDRWIEAQDRPLSRPEAIRCLVEHALAAAPAKQPAGKETARKASKLAAREIEPRRQIDAAWKNRRGESER